MEQKEDQLRVEFTELNQKLQDPAIYSDKNYPKLARRQAELEEIVGLFDEKTELEGQISEAQTMSQDTDVEMASLAATELEQLTYKLSTINDKLSKLLTPKTPTTFVTW